MQFKELHRGELFVLISDGEVVPILRKTSPTKAHRVEGVDIERKLISRYESISIETEALVQRVMEKSIRG